MARPRMLAAPAALALVLLLGSCGSVPPAQGNRASSGTQPAAAQRAKVVRVVAVGDIACRPDEPVTPTTCQQRATAALARRLDPNAVLTLGDTQYDRSSTAEFRSYAASWGSLRPRTRPAIGNHEYLTPGAQGYYAYFRYRQPGPPGYYRVQVGAWQVYVLNSNCGKVSCTREAAWLDRQMRAHPSRCSMVTMHHPRYSSGLAHGNDPAVIPLWRAAYRHRTDVVLAGHDHDYERFVRMDAVGHLRPTRGMVSFVVGTGGRNLYTQGTRKAGSAYYQARSFGVLRLSLGPRRYSWTFRTIGGQALDSGSRTCL